MSLMKPLVAAAVLVTCATAALVLASGFGSSDQPGVLDLLAVPQPVEQIHIFPQTQGQEYTRATSYLRAVELGGRPYSRFQKTDGGIIDTYFRADRTREFVLEYFPSQPASPNLLKFGRQYGNDGEKLVADSAFSADGLRVSHGKRLANDNYQVLTYYDDGITPASVSEVGQGPNAFDHAVALTETRWRRNGTVSMFSVLNADNSRTVTSYDEKQLPIQMTKLTQYGNGSTVSAFYPGTKQVRLESTSDYSKTAARWFRADGTLEQTAEISSGMVKVVYYDGSGQKILLTQTWLFERVEQNGIASMKDLHIYQVVEPDAGGADLRTWTWLLIDKSRALWSYEESNVPWPPTPSLVCEKYRIYYNKDTGLADKAVCGLPDRKVQDPELIYTARDNIRPPPVSAADLVVPKLDDNLPIPKEQSYFEH